MEQKFFKVFIFCCFLAIGIIGQGCGQTGSGQAEGGSKRSSGAYKPLTTDQIGEVCSIISESKLRSYFRLAEEVKFGKYQSALGLDHTCGVVAQTEGHGLQMQVRVSPMADEEIYETSLEVAQMQAKKTVSGLGEHAHWNHAPAAGGMRTSILLIHQSGFALEFVLMYAGPLSEGEIEKATEKLATDFLARI